MTYYNWFSVPCSERKEAKDSLDCFGLRYKYKEGEFYDQIEVWCDNQESLIAVKLRFRG